ncbi:Aldo/keto reductase [Macrophomina phaseolina MS6]|uniref:Aldo/keto reductase n=2 Tax=Macrophomina phaseolina TaxID=35725 RepID=K2S4D8_MACPH|nr:Aldo/keto reductase [Macrophomina phaseolina MS6]KAH7047365.1 NADP-dependent oxidoreductase domain-containing protein [Macrophomina phaseolina]
MSHPTYVFGSHQIESLSKEELQTVVDILNKNGIKNIDTARIYGDSEKRLGEIEAAKSFIIDTKAPGFVSGALSRDSIINGINTSLSLLNTDKVDIYYLHAPDHDTPIEETVDTIQELYRQGKFERFGLSNFLPEDVRKVHAYAKSKGGVLPSVYQGNYNAFARSIERDLFPVLRELGFAFYAYSPLAGGFFAKDPDDLAAKKAAGRFDASTFGGQMYNTLYNKPATIEGLRQWKKIAEQAGDSSVNLAYRWAVFNSKLDVQKGDAIIIGASRPAQLEQTLKALSAGPLKKETVEQIEELWKLVEKDAPLDNFHSFAKDNKR